MTISGERRDEQEEERGGYHIRERRYGSFRRSVALPEDIDESKISARYEDGVLSDRAGCCCSTGAQAHPDTGPER